MCTPLSADRMEYILGGMMMMMVMTSDKFGENYNLDRMECILDVGDDVDGTF